MNTSRVVGVTGHQARDGLDWAWTRATVADLLRESLAGHALSCLAVGSDQVFAEEALNQSIRLTAVIPFAGYDRCFEGPGLKWYRALLLQCSDVITLGQSGSDEQAFLAAGKRVADDCDMLLAVWDGKPAAGLGGTADIVKHAVARGCEVVHLDPFKRSYRRMPSR